MRKFLNKTFEYIKTGYDPFFDIKHCKPIYHDYIYTKYFTTFRWVNVLTKKYYILIPISTHHQVYYSMSKNVVTEKYFF